jgi:hypothetical protein
VEGVKWERGLRWKDNSKSNVVAVRTAFLFRNKEMMSSYIGELIGYSDLISCGFLQERYFSLGYGIFHLYVFPFITQ